MDFVAEFRRFFSTQRRWWRKGFFKFSLRHQRLCVEKLFLDLIVRKC
jgi:hypothetical protein